MSAMKPIMFTNSQLKTPVHVYPSQIFAIMYLPELKTTAILGEGGAMVPVLGDQDEIEKIVTAAKANIKSAKKPKEKANGI